MPAIFESPSSGRIVEHEKFKSQVDWAKFLMGDNKNDELACEMNVKKTDSNEGRIQGLIHIHVESLS